MNKYCKTIIYSSYNLKLKQKSVLSGAKMLLVSIIKKNKLRLKKMLVLMTIGKLIGFYIIVALRIICKRMIMKYYFKIRFWTQVKCEWFLERKLDEKWYKGCITDWQRCTSLQKLCHKLIFFFLFTFSSPFFFFYSVVLNNLKKMNI